jgi:hypothetical protein
MIDNLGAEDLVDMLTGLGALTERTRARLALVASVAPAAPSGDDEMLTAATAATLIGMSEDWMRRHGEREGLARRIGRRTVRYSRAAIEQYRKRSAFS